ncbi:MAG: hypothetical protein JXB14_04770 [Candidatus Altiarchaeota archaeon]|nr:hypothetical protein [Candidatus Altiarchaeota archaeon]
MEIQFSGIKLGKEEQGLVNGLIDHLISRGFEIESLNIELKESKKAGGRSLYTTQLRVEAESSLFSSEVTDWAMEKSLRAAFRKIEKEMKR